MKKQKVKHTWKNEKGEILDSLTFKYKPSGIKSDTSELMIALKMLRCLNKAMGEKKSVVYFSIRYDEDNQVVVNYIDKEETENAKV